MASLLALRLIVLSSEYPFLLEELKAAQGTAWVEQKRQSEPIHPPYRAIQFNNPHKPTHRLVLHLFRCLCHACVPVDQLG